MTHYLWLLFLIIIIIRTRCETLVTIRHSVDSSQVSSAHIN